MHRRILAEVAVFAATVRLYDASAILWLCARSVKSAYVMELTQPQHVGDRTIMTLDHEAFCAGCHLAPFPAYL